MIVPQDCEMLAVKLFHDWLLAVVVSDFFLSNYNELKNFILHFDLHKKQNIPIVISVFFITIKIICQEIWVFWYKYTVNRSERLAILQSIFIPIVICWNYKVLVKVEDSNILRIIKSLFSQSPKIVLLVRLI